MIKILKKSGLLSMVALAAMVSSFQASALTQSKALEVATRQANEGAGFIITAIDNITRQFNEVHAITAGLASLPPTSSINQLSYDDLGVITVAFKKSGIAGPLAGTIVKFVPKNDDGENLNPSKDTSIHAWECRFTPSRGVAQMKQMQVTHNIFASANFPLQSCEPEEAK